jgi:hypothetical protein
MEKKKRQKSNTQRNKERILKQIDDLLSKWDIEDYLANPEIPEAFGKPSFLIVPRLGKTVILDVQILETKNTLWNFTLQKIEELAEYKIATGENTAVVLLLAGDVDADHDAVLLLKRLFDTIVMLSQNEIESPDILERKLHGPIFDSPVQNQAFWEEDIILRNKFLSLISKNTHLSNIIKDYQLIDNPETPVFDDQKQVVQFLEDILKECGFNVLRNLRVFNSKQNFIRGETSYFFTFDLAASTTHILHNSHYLLHDELEDFFAKGSFLATVIRGGKPFYQIRDQLLALASRAMFIRYRIGSSNHPTSLFFQHIKPRLYLIMDGDFFGPEHAPARYLEMLVASGWIPMRLVDFKREICN